MFECLFTTICRSSWNRLSKWHSCKCFATVVPSRAVHYYLHNKYSRIWYNNITFLPHSDPVRRRFPLSEFQVRALRQINCDRVQHRSVAAGRIFVGQVRTSNGTYLRSCKLYTTRFECVTRTDDVLFIERWWFFRET